MNVLRLSLCNLRFRALSTFFNVLVLAFGIATIVALLQLSDQVEHRLDRDLKGIDLVVGAKGSPIQLILSGVFHLEAPVGNIPLEDAQKLAKNPMIKTAIPVALGDSFRGFRIVGTTPGYPKHYGAQLAQGDYWKGSMQAVLGSEVARASGLNPGDTFVGSHGLVEGGEEHKEFPYTVTGTLAPTGTVVDRLVFADVASVWNVHEHHEEDHHEAAAAPSADPAAAPPAPRHEEEKSHPRREVTALLISYSSDYAAVRLPALVNKSSAMMAANPAQEMHRLWGIIGIGSETITFFGKALMVIASAGFFVTLWSAVSDRRYDIALMRSLGATRRRIFSFVLIEGLTLGALGVLLGLLLGHGFAWEVRQMLEQTRHMTLQSEGFNAYELCLALAALVLSAAVSLIPAFLAYRVNVQTVLSKNA